MGEKPLSEARKRANAKYQANNTVQFSLKMNKRTDADIIEKFNHEKQSGDGLQGYVKKLVRDDLKAHD